MNFRHDIIQFLKEKIPHLKGIYLFGSHADGTAHADSDVDIAFLTERPLHLSAYDRFHLGVDLGEIIGASVDLIDLHSMNTDFRFVIISTAERIYCADRYFCDSFEMTAYSMYQRLEEERQAIIEDVKQRGRVYG